MICKKSKISKFNLFAKRSIENPLSAKPLGQSSGAPEDPSEAHIFPEYIRSTSYTSN